MTKKKIGIIGGISLGLFIMISVGFVNRDRLFTKKKVQESVQSTVTPTPKEELITWDDPAGFTFQYQKNLLVDKHDEDQENYAHIELTNPDYKGSVVIWAKDTNAIAITQWVKNEKTLKDQSFVDTKLGGNDAVKVLVQEPKKKLVTATLDEDIVVIIETNLETPEYWQKINDTVIGSFRFSMSQAGIQEDQSTASSDEVPSAEADEEESVE